MNTKRRAFWVTRSISVPTILFSLVLLLPTVNFRHQRGGTFVVLALSDYDPELYNITLADERTHLETVYTSVVGVSIAATTGACSSFCSLVIMYLILKSRSKLSTIYHRLIFCLSIYEVIISIAIAFTTLPMPKDMIYNQFNGLILGNTSTCSAQGFLFILGAQSAGLYNSFLMVYYLLSIRYQMPDANISKLVEPLMHAYTTAFGFSISISLLVFDAYNPTPYDVWCTAITYPYWCPGSQDQACLIRGSRSSYHVRNIMLLHNILSATVVLSSLCLVIWTIYSQERLFVMYRANIISRLRLQETFEQDFYLTKAILKQASAYALSFLLVNIFPFISMVFGRPNNTFLSIAHLLLRPSQGVFNLLIFLYHKIYNIKRNNRNASLCHAIVDIFNGSYEPENAISTIYLVRQDEENKEGVWTGESNGEAAEKKLQNPKLGLPTTKGDTQRGNTDALKDIDLSVAEASSLEIKELDFSAAKLSKNAVVSNDMEGVDSQIDDNHDLSNVGSLNGFSQNSLFSFSSAGNSSFGWKTWRSA